MKRKGWAPLYAMIVVFILPMIAAWILFYFHDYFHTGTTNHGTLINPPRQTVADPARRWQVVYVSGKVCDHDCQTEEIQLRQMLKLLGQDRRRVVGLRQDSFEHLPAERIYLVDPLGNIFMYYSPSVNPVDIYRDLKHLLRVSRIG